MNCNSSKVYIEVDKHIPRGKAFALQRGLMALDVLQGLT
jgi:hypothetical protein